MNRREFLKRCYQIGGYAAIAGLGLGAVEDALGWGIMPAVVGSGAGGLTGVFSVWDETTKSGIANSKILACFMENINANGNETAEGHDLSGDDLVFTRVGTIPSATGTPPTRDFEFGYMALTQTCAEILKSKTWAIALKLNTFSDAEGTLFQISNGDGGSDMILRLYNNGNRLRLTCKTTGGTLTATAAPTTGDIWIVAQANGRGNVTIGWDNAKINNFSDLPAGQKDVLVGEIGDLSAQDFSSRVYLLSSQIASLNPAYQVTTKIYYILLASDYLVGA